MTENKVIIKRAIRPNAQPFDEFRIVTVPRYKTSELSGNEWRISHKMQLLRKGIVVYESTDRDILIPIRDMVDKLEEKAHDRGNVFGESYFCDQEGCSSKSDDTKKLLDTDKKEENTIFIRRFCKYHSKRGDCGIEDSDDNYQR